MQLMVLLSGRSPCRCCRSSRRRCTCRHSRRLRRTFTPFIRNKVSNLMAGPLSRPAASFCHPLRLSFPSSLRTFSSASNTTTARSFQCCNAAVCLCHCLWRTGSGSWKAKAQPQSACCSAGTSPRARVRGAEIDGVKGNGTHARTDRATDRTSCSALLCLTVASGGRRNRYKFKR